MGQKKQLSLRTSESQNLSFETWTLPIDQIFAVHVTDYFPIKVDDKYILQWRCREIDKSSMSNRGRNPYN